VLDGNPDFPTVRRRGSGGNFGNVFYVVQTEKAKKCLYLYNDYIILYIILKNFCILQFS